MVGADAAVIAQIVMDDLLGQCRRCARTPPPPDCDGDKITCSVRVGSGLLSGWDSVSWGLPAVRATFRRLASGEWAAEQHALIGVDGDGWWVWASAAGSWDGTVPRSAPKWWPTSPGCGGSQ